MKFPKVKIEGVSMDENNYDDGFAVWNSLKLIEHSKKYKVFHLPLVGINLGGCPWSKEMTIDSFLYHSKRIKNTDLKYPIILDDTGVIADGWHRVCKAILKGNTTIKAIRLETMPKPDKYHEI